MSGTTYCGNHVTCTTVLVLSDTMATYAWPASFIETFGKYIRTRHFATTLQGRVKGWKGHKAQIQVGLFLGLVNP